MEPVGVKIYKNIENSYLRMDDRNNVIFDRIFLMKMSGFEGAENANGVILGVIPDPARRRGGLKWRP